MYTIVPNHLIDRRRWDDLVNASPEPLVYSLSWYLDAVAPEQWNVLVNEDYTVGIPMVVGVKMGQHYCYQPMYAQRFLISSYRPLAANEQAEVMAQCLAQFDLIDIQTEIEAGQLPQGVTLLDRHTQELPMNCAYDALNTQYKTGLKQSIQKAVNAKLRLCKDLPLNEFEDFVLHSSLYEKQKGYRDKHMSLMQLIALGREHSEMGCWGVYHPDGALICACVFAIHQGSIYKIFMCGSPLSRKLCGGHFLTDAMIKEYAERLHKFDFAGSNMPSIGFFNLQFGAVDRCYQQLTLSRGSIAKLGTWMRKQGLIRKK